MTQRVTVTLAAWTGLQPHKVREIWLHATDAPDHFVDTSETLDVKIAALRCHRSQVGDGEWLERAMRDFASRIGQLGGLPFAEAFRKYAVP